MRVKLGYLHESKAGILRYRRPFPPELRPFLIDNWKGKTELKRSLRARSIDEPGAFQLYQAASGLYARLVSQAQKAAEGQYDDLTPPLIAFLAEAYRVQALADDEARRLDSDAKARGELVTAVAIAAGYKIPQHRATSRWAQGLRVAIDAALDVYRGYSADGDLDGLLDAWGELASSLAASHGLRVFAPLVVYSPTLGALVG